jgi:hypothetical protein
MDSVYDPHSYKEALQQIGAFNASYQQFGQVQPELLSWQLFQFIVVYLQLHVKDCLCLIAHR